MIPGIVAGRPKPSHWLPFTPYINLPFEGPNGSTTFTDTTGRTWTGNGDAKISDAQSAIGSSSLLLDGSGAYIQTNSAPAIQMQGDFRMRCYVRPASIGSQKCIASKRPSTGPAEFALSLLTSGVVQFYCATVSSTIAVLLESAVTISAGAWARVEVRKSGSSWWLLIDDIIADSDTQSGTINTGSELFLIGRDRTNTSRDWNGYIDEFVFERPT